MNIKHTIPDPEPDPSVQSSASGGPRTLVPSSLPPETTDPKAEGITAADRARLRELAAKATPGPWEVEHDFDRHADEDDEPGGTWPVAVGPFNYVEMNAATPAEEEEANFALVALAREVAVPLLDALNAAEDRASFTQMSLDGYEEVSAELFALCCSVLDNAPDAPAARASLAEHIEHVRRCRAGSCRVELGDTTRSRAEADLAALRAWRDTVTVALGNPGGTAYADVPAEVRRLRVERDTARAALRLAQTAIGGLTGTCEPPPGMTLGDVFDAIEAALAAEVKS